MNSRQWAELFMNKSKRNKKKKKISQEKKKYIQTNKNCLQKRQNRPFHMQTYKYMYVWK